MDKIINIGGKTIEGYDRLIMELNILRDEVDARIERLKAMCAAGVAGHDGAARYQRTRMICSNKVRARGYLDGRGR